LSYDIDRLYLTIKNVIDFKELLQAMRVHFLAQILPV